jgi:DNA-binding IscR family transcriptional regulator
MYFVGSAFRDPGRKVTLSDISGELTIPTIALAPVVNDLENAGLIVTTEQEYLIPGRDIARISLHDILDVVRAGGETGSYRDPCWTRAIEELGSRIESAVADTVADRTLAGMLDEAAKGRDGKSQQ